MLEIMHVEVDVDHNQHHSDTMQTVCTFKKYILCTNVFTLSLGMFLNLGYYWSDIVKMATYCDMMQTLCLCTFRKYILCPNLFTLILLVYTPGVLLE